MTLSPLHCCHPRRRFSIQFSGAHCCVNTWIKSGASFSMCKPIKPQYLQRFPCQCGARAIKKDQNRVGQRSIAGDHRQATIRPLFLPLPLPSPTRPHVDGSLLLAGVGAAAQNARARAAEPKAAGLLRGCATQLNKLLSLYCFGRIQRRSVARKGRE